MNRLMALLYRREAAPAQSRETSSGLGKRDLAEIAAGAESLPGTWQVETNDGDVVHAWLRPNGDRAAPTFTFARGDGYFLVRMSREPDADNSNLMVFGAFTSMVTAFDTIHNDVLSAYWAK